MDLESGANCLVKRLAPIMGVGVVSGINGISDVSICNSGDGFDFPATVQIDDSISVNGSPGQFKDCLRDLDDKTVRMSSEAILAETYEYIGDKAGEEFSVGTTECKHHVITNDSLTCVKDVFNRDCYGELEETPEGNLDGDKYICREVNEIFRSLNGVVNEIEEGVTGDQNKQLVVRDKMQSQTLEYAINETYNNSYVDISYICRTDGFSINPPLNCTEHRRIALDRTLDNSSVNVSLLNIRECQPDYNKHELASGANNEYDATLYQLLDEPDNDECLSDISECTEPDDFPALMSINSCDVLGDDTPSVVVVDISDVVVLELDGEFRPRVGSSSTPARTHDEQQCKDHSVPIISTNDSINIEIPKITADAIYPHLTTSTTNYISPLSARATTILNPTISQTATTPTITPLNTPHVITTPLNPMPQSSISISITGEKTTPPTNTQPTNFDINPNFECISDLVTVEQINNSRFKFVKQTTLDLLEQNVNLQNDADIAIYNGDGDRFDEVYLANISWLTDDRSDSNINVNNHLKELNNINGDPITIVHRDEDEKEEPPIDNDQVNNILTEEKRLEESEMKESQHSTLMNIKYPDLVTTSSPKLHTCSGINTVTTTPPLATNSSISPANNLIIHSSTIHTLSIDNDTEEMSKSSYLSIESAASSNIGQPYQNKTHHAAHYVTDANCPILVEDANSTGCETIDQTLKIKKQCSIPNHDIVISIECAQDDSIVEKITDMPEGHSLTMHDRSNSTIFCADNIDEKAESNTNLACERVKDDLDISVDADVSSTSSLTLLALARFTSRTPRVSNSKATPPTHASIAECGQ